MLMLFSTALLAQNKKTESLKVYGNCGMCKTTIESALTKQDGILKKSWDKSTKVLTVTFNADKISMKEIAEKIANAGYDNELAKAPDATYNKLHSCCQYDRPNDSK